MEMRVHPLALAVALGLITHTVLEVLIDETDPDSATDDTTGHDDHGVGEDDE
jgi:hypothetical protein